MLNYLPTSILPTGVSKNPLGIGLNIVKKIIEQHKGTISARIEASDIIFEITILRIDIFYKKSFFQSQQQQGR